MSPFENHSQALTAAILGVIVSFLMLVADVLEWVAKKLNIDLTRL